MAAEKKKKKKKHLHELLEDDQEPFHLNHYISDLRSQMGCSDSPIKKRKPENAAVLPHGFFSCESSCFFATHTNKSPLFELRSPAKKKVRDGLQIPARTAGILLEAAARIQKQQTEKSKNRARNRGNAFGMFGSVLKRLTNRKTKPRLDGNAVLSEQTCTNSSSERERFVEVGDKCFCESAFHFVLHTTPSTSGHRTPHFTSTATSPARRSTEDEDSDETESLEKVRGQEESKEEEDNEQCSPVSVLDPLEDDEDHHQREPDHHHNLPSCSFEVVQRAEEEVDAVVQKDMRGLAGECTRHGGEVEEAVADLELSIFLFLIDEFSHELVYSHKSL